MNPLSLLVLLVPAALLCLAAAPARAESIQTISLDSTTVAGTTKSLSGSTFTATLADLTVDDVTFDVTLTVTGTGTLTQTTGGLGVSGGSSGLLNQGEGLTFSLAIGDVSGGEASFLGFRSVDFTFFGTAGETAVFSTDASLTTTSDNWLTHTALTDPDISCRSPLAFTLFGQDGTAPNGQSVTTSFRVDGIDAAFETTTPVPEPGSIVLCGGAAVLAAWRLRRRRSRG